MLSVGADHQDADNASASDVPTLPSQATKVELGAAKPGRMRGTTTCTRVGWWERTPCLPVY
eukprot:15354699-Ditylum_brightwellii.AAC.1